MQLAHRPSRPVPVLPETSIILTGAAKIAFWKMLFSAMANIGVSKVYAGIGSSMSVGTAAALALIAFAGILTIKAGKHVSLSRQGNYN